MARTLAIVVNHAEAELFWDVRSYWASWVRAHLTLPLKDVLENGFGLPFKDHEHGAWYLILIDDNLWHVVNLHFAEGGDDEHDIGAKLFKSLCGDLGVTIEDINILNKFNFLDESWNDWLKDQVGQFNILEF